MAEDKFVVAFPYGFCPKCGFPGKLRERRIDGNDICQHGHTYPSRSAINSAVAWEIARHCRPVMEEETPCLKSRN